MCGTPRAPGDYVTASALVAIAPDEVVPRNRTGTLDEEAGPASVVSLRSTFSPKGKSWNAATGGFRCLCPHFCFASSRPQSCIFLHIMHDFSIIHTAFAS